MSTADVLQLQQPLTDGGIRSVNFFNGRLLASKDLSREQAARRESDWRLGLAVGDGVAFGFEVDQDKSLSTPSAPVLSVKAGLAINRKGQTLRLTDDTRVALTRRFEAVGTTCLFSDCVPLGGGTYVAGAGVYVLTVAPAESSEGRAMTNGTDPTNVRCNTDATVEAVQFRLLTVKPSLYIGLDAASDAFRNRLAYLCFGTANRHAWLGNLFGPDIDGYGLLDGMRSSSGLTDFDVPLALIFMAGSGTVKFIDRWAVRRTPSGTPETPQWLPLTSRRRLAEGQAMFMQFQEQIASLRTGSGDLGSVTASSRFALLPPVGVIPVSPEVDATDALATKFFAGLTYRSPVFINVARLETLIRQSLTYPPIDVTSGEMMWLYRVRENAMAAEFSSGARPQRLVVFASGHLPYVGDAQFDLAYWNYSNYALAR